MKSIDKSVLIRVLPVVIIPLVFVLMCISFTKKETAIYVSLAGNDSWSGMIKEPNSSKTDGPFATFERAKEKAREMKKTGDLPDGGLHIYIREGNYCIKKSFVLLAEDSGLDGKPIIWGAYPGEKVRFIGGTVISGFQKISDEKIRAKFQTELRDKIVQTNLKALGITYYGHIAEGEDFRFRNIGMELFFNDKPMTMARWPNSGFVRIKDVPQYGCPEYHDTIVYIGDRNFVRDGLPVGRHYGRFTYDDPRPKKWDLKDDLFMHGYFQWDWRDIHKRIKMIDTVKNEIYPDLKYSDCGYHIRQRYYYFNIIEELDSIGEYYIDRQNGILFFYPPSPVSDGIAYVSDLEEPGIILENASNITFENIFIEGLIGDAVRMINCKNCLLAGCTIRNIAGIGVLIDNGIDKDTKNGVLSCDIYDVKWGARIIGGNRKTLEGAGNFIKNCDIHHFGRVVKTYTPAVEILGVGNLLANNHIHHGPHQGVQIKGNENILEYNEIDNLALETGDVGAFYAHSGWCQRNNKYRFNYFHDLLGPGDQGVNAMYCDDYISGEFIYGNIFVNAGHNVYLGGGRDNHIENNIFIYGSPGVFINGQGRSWAYRSFEGRTGLQNELDTFDYKNPPYSVKYPELLTLYDEVPDLPKNNKILRNISYGGRFLDLYDGFDISITTIKNNLIADTMILKWQKVLVDPVMRKQGIQREFTYYKNGNEEIRQILENDSNVIIKENPFEDIENGKFNPPKGSVAYQLGFKQIPLEKIGLFKDKYRNDIPTTTP
jgi:hypothetical protein